VTTSDQARFENLYRENVRRVLAYALTRATPESAQDAVASTFLVAWRRLDSLPEDAFPWLIGVVRRVLADQRRSEVRRTALGQRLGSLAVPTAPTMDDLPESLALRGSIRDALARLRPQDRDVLVLSAWHGFDIGQLAVALACSKAVASLRLHRARRRFAVLLDAQQDDPMPVHPPTMRPAKETS
jgi:RNA polymerase sigma-70 factor (ECF subfamily)